MDLTVLSKRVKDKKKLQKQLDETNKRISSMEQLLQTLKAEVDEEWEDVERMESGSFASKFYSIFGKQEEKLHKERSEAEAAQQKYMDALYTIQDLQKQKEDLTARLSMLGDPEGEYREGFRRNQTAIENDMGSDGQTYRQLKQEMVALRNTEKEIMEANHAGDRVLSAVQDIQRSLNSASGWGVADMISDSFFADLAKYGSMDEAKRKLSELQRLLRSYSRELSDLNIHLNISMDVGDGMRFADYFFDNIFTDMMTYNKIDNMKREILEVRRQVEHYNHILQQKDASLKEEIRMRKNKAEDLIVRYTG